MSSTIKALLESENTSASVCLKSAETVLGDFRGWEPESIWMSLDKHGIDVPEVNRAKILAAATLKIVPALVWDAHAFEQTSLAFNDCLPNPATWSEATPEQMAWALLEVKRILDQSELDLSSDPTSYAAVVLHRHGFVLAPEELSFAQEVLDKLNKNSGDRKNITEAWTRLDKSKLRDHVFEETEQDVQLARLAGVRIYVDEKEARRLEDAKQLS